MRVTERRSPYQGLIPYEEDDAPFFFGREKEARLIIANLFASPLTLLYGASGVGKSSVLSAGVLPHLRPREDLLVFVFKAWQGDPVDGLKAAVGAAAERVARETLQPPDSASLAEYLTECAGRLNRRLMIILDQFEEYFLYHPPDDAFSTEFSRAVTELNLLLSFLISVREDSVAKLDRFEGRIPNLFGNYFRIEHLDREAAHAAIAKPIEQYNRMRAAQEEQVSVQPALVEAVLDQVRTGQVVLGEAGSRVVAAGTRTNHGDVRIETPYLQLVMTRMWDEEMHAGSRVLRVETLNRLGGAERIVRTHLDGVMSALPEREQEAAANAFHYLVTPGGTKIAHTIPDLVEYSGVPETELARVLTKLSGGDFRIVRPVAPPSDQPKALRYEIFHDVLAPAILDWRRRRAEEMRRREVHASKLDVFRLAVPVNGLDEALRSAYLNFRPDARPFDIIIIGGGTFGCLLAQHLFYLDKTHSHRILVLEAGPYFLPDHCQNLPWGEFTLPYATTISELRQVGTYGIDRPQARVWGLPWHSSIRFPGLAYCLGGRSLYWAGWSPVLLDEEMPPNHWPGSVRDDLRATYFREASEMTGVNVTNDFIFGALHDALRQKLFAAISDGTVANAFPLPQLPLHLDNVPTRQQDLYKLEAPLAMQSHTQSGVLPSKFSAVPLFLKTVWAAAKESNLDDVKKRLMVVPLCHVIRLATDGERVVAIDTNQGSVLVPPNGVVIIALGTIESTRLALLSFPGISNYHLIGRNLMTHLRSDLTIRIPRSALPVD